jgi:hypothetical protein
MSRKKSPASEEAGYSKHLAHTAECNHKIFFPNPESTISTPSKAV